MKPDVIRRVILEELSNIAPETDPAGVDPGADLREALDIDSMDFLNFIAALDKRLAIAVPEADYRELFTIDGAVGYLASKLPAPAR
ncbi:MAG TPA: acyl carrier protein [Arenibaculum sp.]|nr:acyl carrier protein [Arenibaculum sp.]